MITVYSPLEQQGNQKILLAVNGKAPKYGVAKIDSHYFIACPDRSDVHAIMDGYVLARSSHPDFSEQNRCGPMMKQHFIDFKDHFMILKHENGLFSLYEGIHGLADGQIKKGDYVGRTKTHGFHLYVYQLEQMGKLGLRRQNKEFGFEGVKIGSIERIVMG